VLASQLAAGGIKKLKALCDDDKLTKKTFVDYDLNKDCTDLALNEFLAALGHLSVYKMFRWEEPSTPDDFIEGVVNMQPLRSFWKNQKEKQDIKAIIKKSARIFSMPFLATFDGTMNTTEWENLLRSMGETVGSGLHYPFLYFNHSCSPNIGKVKFNSTSCHVVIKPIKKDEQLFESYV